MSGQLTSFHNIIDGQVRPYQSYFGGAWQNITRLITIRERSLTYEFFTHFHPYVGNARAGLPNVPPSQLSLIRRLNEGCVDDLLDADTVYMPQPNSGSPASPLSILPNTTRATLLSSVAATAAGGSGTLTLSPGTPVTLPDGATVTIPAGTVVAAPDGTTPTLGTAVNFALPGQIPVAFSSGIQISASTILPDYISCTVTLAAGTYAVLSNDGTQIQLPAATQVSLRNGLPQPFFFEPIFDASNYNPDPAHITQPYPVRDLDFTDQGAYSVYNWELFFHAPLLIAVHLSQNQKFQDAQHWFHYIFDPTDNGPGPTPERFWKVKPFQYTDTRMIQEILVNLSTKQDPALWQQTVNSITDWMKHPFQPWAVAKHRPTAYMLKTVTAYLDNLIAWGDSLFQQYSIETINEATQIYILAANILGPKPQAVPVKGSSRPLTFNSLRPNLDAFSNALEEIEVDIPFDMAALAGEGVDPGGAQILPSIGHSLYFCIPRNDQFLRYWDTVANRLFNIHNSLNLQGIFQQLPLYDPPIDPALLVRAAASGLDVSAIVSGLNQPLALVRFRVLIAKAVELCQEVQSLGAGLLAAIEKQDGESMTLLRAQHDQSVLLKAQMLKYAQWQDAQKATQALQLTLAGAVQRFSYYQKLLGRTDAQIQSSLPQLDALDLGSLQNLAFTQGEMTSEPQLALDAIAPDIAKNPTSVTDGEIVTLSNNEVAELTKLQDARDKQSSAAGQEGTASDLGKIPDFGINVNPWMNVGLSTTLGGTYASKFPQATARSDRADADGSTYEANKTAKLGTYSRRELEWTFQSNSARADMNQTQKQIRGAQIREAIAARDYEGHELQITNAQQVLDFLQGNDVPGALTKETTVPFYAWMKREVKALYSKAFQLAYATAKKAERALQNEIGDPSLNYLQFSYLDGIEGLLAGERLLLDLRAMETAYLDLDQREYELTKHISLMQIDPLALLRLRATGSCEFVVPEEALDLDCPGHYFRRIKSVAITLPCVAGPYSGINCTLTQQASTIRIDTSVPGGHYARQGSDDIRFNDYFGTIQSIVTSSGQSDSGLFDANLDGERNLPFERSGIAGSRWQLTLPSDIPQFDFDTITDVILHVRYTAREGGESLRAAAVANLQGLIKKGQTVGSIRLFSLRREFSTQWAKFRQAVIAAATPTAQLSLGLESLLYPFWAQAAPLGSAPKIPVLESVEFFAQLVPGSATSKVNINDKADQSGNSDALVRDPSLGGLLSGELTKIALPKAITDAAKPLTLYFDNNSMEDLWVALTWGN